MNAPILVVGATGPHGGTGTTVVNPTASTRRPPPPNLDAFLSLGLRRTTVGTQPAE
jgi:hypothetical protein